jgi:hypothetical protein
MAKDNKAAMVKKNQKEPTAHTTLDTEKIDTSTDYIKEQILIAYLTGLKLEKYKNKYRELERHFSDEVISALDPAKIFMHALKTCQYIAIEYEKNLHVVLNIDIKATMHTKTFEMFNVIMEKVNDRIKLDFYEKTRPTLTVAHIHPNNDTVSFSNTALIMLYNQLTTFIENSYINQPRVYGNVNIQDIYIKNQEYKYSTKSYAIQIILSVKPEGI